MGIFQFFGIKSKKQIIVEALEQGAIIVDVRTPQEYNEGHIRDSINIPLQQLDARISTLKKKGKPVITCCRSGGRSRRAKAILEKNGVKTINGGGWGALNYMIH